MSSTREVSRRTMIRGAVTQELAPSVCRDISWRAMVFQGRNALDPTGRDSRGDYWRWCSDARSGLLRQ
jgi:hypothetical protein